jgi:SAM-dependent methyltransferase
VTATGPVGPTRPLHSTPQLPDVSVADPPNQGIGAIGHSPATRNYLLHIEPFTRPFGEAAVEALIDAAPLPLRHVLDHGAGTGQVARLLHDRVPAVTVRCLDPNADLLRAAPCGPLNDWSVVQVGTASDLAPTDRFDGIISNIVLPFTADAINDMGQLRTTLRAGCPLVTVTLGRAEHVEPFFAYWDTFRSIDPTCWEPERYVHFRFGETKLLEGVLMEAGFSTITVAEISVTRELSVEAVWEWLSSALPLGRGEGYSAPSEDLAGLAQTAFLARFRDKTCWTTQCLLAVATCETV